MNMYILNIISLLIILYTYLLLYSFRGGIRKAEKVFYHTYIIYFILLNIILCITFSSNIFAEYWDFYFFALIMVNILLLQFTPMHLHFIHLSKAIFLGFKETNKHNIYDMWYRIYNVKYAIFIVIHS